ncbi:hypothetical protein PtA15_14A83 [Puccinia triticina]|uniref:Uncharacterized protein n=1 Tax=Puccinia triticina TaxID=208348 RepID=A0ABY7D4L1_9BASI|nr:uncharacterized protein PtA15_14A83 [Puccinia triticina]WAQ91202.1 hypothetical protein PtA15_14A83 [Puccinia triticina]
MAGFDTAVLPFDYIQIGSEIGSENETNENENGYETERRKEIVGITVSETGREKEIEWIESARKESIGIGNETESETGNGNGNGSDHESGNERGIGTASPIGPRRHSRSPPRLGPPPVDLRRPHSPPPPLGPPSGYVYDRRDSRDRRNAHEYEYERSRGMSFMDRRDFDRYEPRRASLRDDDYDRRRRDEWHSAGRHSAASLTHSAPAPAFSITRAQDFYTASTAPAPTLAPALVFPIPFSDQSSVFTFLSSWSLASPTSTVFPFPLAVPLAFARQTTLPSALTPNRLFIPSETYPFPLSITKARSRSCSPPPSPKPSQSGPVLLSKAGAKSSSTELNPPRNPPTQSNPDAEAVTTETALPPSATASASIQVHQTSQLQLTESALGLTDQSNHLISIEKNSLVDEAQHCPPLGIKPRESISSAQCTSILTPIDSASDSRKPALADFKTDSAGASSGPGKPRASVDIDSAPLTSASALTGSNQPAPTRPADDQLTNDRHHKRAKLESFPPPQDHPAGSTQRKSSNPQTAREEHKSNRAESSRSGVSKDSIPPPPQKYHPSPASSAPRNYDHSYHRSSYTGSSSQHSSRGNPSSPASYRAPLAGTPGGSRTALPAGPRSWSSSKMPATASTVPGSSVPNNPSAKESTKYSHPDPHDGSSVPDRASTRQGTSPKAHLNSPLPLPPKTPSDKHTPSHTRGTLMSGPTLNTPASEVPPLNLNPLLQPGSTTPKGSLPAGSLSPTVNFSKSSGMNSQLGSSSPTPISGTHAKTTSGAGPSVSSLRNELNGSGSTGGHPANGFHSSVGSTGSASAPGQQFRVNNYPSPKNFAGYPPTPGYPPPNNPPALVSQGPPPPPPVLVDKDFERAQRMVDVCPGLAQEVAKLRSTRNSGMLASHLSSQFATQKALMDLHWQASELKTLAERRKLAENQLEKLGGGISLGMGF